MSFYNPNNITNFSSKFTLIIHTPWKKFSCLVNTQKPSSPYKVNIAMHAICCVWIILCTFISNTDSSEIECNNAFQCTGDIGSSGVNQGWDEVYGFGYKSLFQSPSSGAWYRYCLGGFSCAETPYIETTFMNCHGTSSCTNVENIHLTHYLYAYGSSTLTNSTFSFFGTVTDCYGDTSCAHSTFSRSSSLASYQEAYGAFSFYKTTLNISGSGYYNAYYRGYYAGYESTMYCGNGATCRIYCAHNGCGGLSVICDRTAFCMVYSETTSSLLPNMNIYLQYLNGTIVHKNVEYNVNNTEILFWNPTVIVTNNDEECSSTAANTFDNYQEHYKGADLIYTEDVGPICCRAESSCQETSISYNSLTASVVCNGVDSCLNLHVISTGDLMVECSASSACYSANINGNGGIGGIVYCFGYDSCDFATISKISNIFCTGYVSCDSAIISSSGTNMTLSLISYQSGQNALVTCNKNDYCSILCYGFEACLNLKLYCYGTCVIECNEDTSCPIEFTADPSQSPTLSEAPTDFPTYNPTMAYTGSTSSKKKSDATTIVIVVIAIVCIIVVISVILFIFWKKKNNDKMALELELGKNNNKSTNDMINQEGVASGQKTMVGHDPATGLPMKSIMYEQLVHLCNKNELNVAVCSADMDGMKQLNDSLGHQITDNIIKSIADILAKESRESANVSTFRMNAGGDEFAMIVRDTNEKAVIQWADDLRKEIDFSTKASISVGVAIRNDKETKKQWFNRAESALIDAKNQGKNRVVLAESVTKSH
eukprot:250841_1